jgi:Trypsin
MIRLGEVDANQENECNDDGFCLQEEDFEVEKIIVHPNYNQPRYANDIALLRLKQSTGSSSKFAFLVLKMKKFERKTACLSMKWSILS